MIKLFFIFLALILFVPFFLVFLFFTFPPTRKIIAYLLNRKIQKMAKNGHVYYRTYHYKSGTYQSHGGTVRDVTPDENIIDVSPISDSNLRDVSSNQDTAR